GGHRPAVRPRARRALFGDDDFRSAAGAASEQSGPAEARVPRGARAHPAGGVELHRYRLPERRPHHDAVEPAHSADHAERADWRADWRGAGEADEGRDLPPDLHELRRLDRGFRRLDRASGYEARAWARGLSVPSWRHTH